MDQISQGSSTRYYRGKILIISQHDPIQLFPRASDRGEEFHLNQISDHVGAPFSPVHRGRRKNRFSRFLSADRPQRQPKGSGGQNSNLFTSYAPVPEARHSLRLTQDLWSFRRNSIRLRHSED
jgi:hypothetical protein